MRKKAYSKEFYPPAPVFVVKIVAPEESPTALRETALIDTGADGTFVPTSILEKLALPIVYMTNVRSHLGEQLYRVPIHKVDFILFDTIRLPSIEVVADDRGNNIIIGRNLLNKLSLLLDGPNQVTTILE
ncbi:MAG: hypothetical protein MAG431_02213 [Chloroflexi bacterium]|nr:hypothetical protein [Chloroflexota bacterium]